MRALIVVSLTALLATGVAAQDNPKVRLDVTKLPGSAPTSAVSRSGGTFVWGQSADATSLDPAAVTDSESVTVITNIFDTLVSFGPGSTEIVPWLAERWTTSADQLAWTFHLRKDVKFHDGTPLNASAVVFSFQRQMDKKHPARRADDAFYYFQSNFRMLRSVEATDEFTVRFTLSAPYGPFLSAMALFSCGIVSPAAWKSEGMGANGRYKYNFAARPVGTGPFVFESWKRPSHITLDANKQHFSGAPPIDKLVFRVIRDPQARLTELEAGNVHGMANPALGDLESIHADTRLRLVARPGINICYLAMNTLKKPFGDMRVRQAVAYAIDKKRLITAGYDGLAEPAVTMCPKGLNGHLDRIDRRIDLKKARGLLEEAGYRDGFDVRLMYSGTPRTYLPDPETTAMRIQRDLKQIGIRVRLDKRDWATYLRAVQHGEHEMCVLGWMADIFDPDNFLYALLDKENAVPGRANNVSFYKSERVHKLLIDARRSSEWAMRKRLYIQAQEIVFDEVPVLPLATAASFRVLREEVRGYTICPAGESFRDVSFK